MASLCCGGADEVMASYAPGHSVIGFFDRFVPLTQNEMRTSYGVYPSESDMRFARENTEHVAETIRSGITSPSTASLFSNHQKYGIIHSIIREMQKEMRNE